MTFYLILRRINCDKLVCESLDQAVFKPARSLTHVDVIGYSTDARNEVLRGGRPHHVTMISYDEVKVSVDPSTCSSYNATQSSCFVRERVKVAFFSRCFRRKNGASVCLAASTALRMANGLGAV